MRALFAVMVMLIVTPALAHAAAAQPVKSTTPIAVDLEKATPPPVSSYKQDEVPKFGSKAEQVGPRYPRPEKNTIAYPVDDE